MPKLPRVSGEQTIRALERLGFVRARQSGSHVVLRKRSPDKNRLDNPCHLVIRVILISPKQNSGKVPSQLSFSLISGNAPRPQRRWNDR